MSIRDRVNDTASRIVLGTALALPYRLRVPLVGWVMSHLIAPVAGWRRRIRENLAHVMPELPPAEVERLVRAVPDQVGRSLIEIYSGEEFIARTADSRIEGPGAEALEQARAEGRPLVIVTAHLGNYDAMRGKLSRVGIPMAALYRPMSNPLFNAHYVEAITAIAGPMYPTDIKGIARFIGHLRKGGNLAIAADVGATKAPLLSFLGKPAHTPVSAAAWALKYDALMIPIFGIRNPDGLSFRIHVANPVAPATPEEMMQAYNDVVADVVRKHPEQWFWIHRRWKTLRKGRKD